MKGRARALLIGGLSGALVGLVGTWLHLRSVQSRRRSDPALNTSAELIKLGFSIVAVLRQIADLGRAATV